VECWGGGQLLVHDHLVQLGSWLHRKHLGTYIGHDLLALASWSDIIQDIQEDLLIQKAYRSLLNTCIFLVYFCFQVRPGPPLSTDTKD